MDTQFCQRTLLSSATSAASICVSLERSQEASRSCRPPGSAKDPWIVQTSETTTKRCTLSGCRYVSQKLTSAGSSKEIAPLDFLKGVSNLAQNNWPWRVIFNWAEMEEEDLPPSTSGP